MILMKTTKLILATLLIGLMVISCKVGLGKKDKDEDKNLLTFLYLDSISGHCAKVTKENNTYTADLSPIPKGGCNAGTILGGTTKEDIENKLKNDFNELITLINNEFSTECGNEKSALQSIVDNPPALFDTQAQNLADQLANGKIKFYPIDNLVEEGKNFLINVNPNDDITNEEDVKTLKAASLEEYKKYYKLYSLMGFSDPSSSCKTAVQNKMDQEFSAENYFILINHPISGNLFAIPTDTTNKDNKVLQAQCYYGSGANQNQKCSTLNNEF